MMEEATHRLKSPEALAELYRAAGVELGRPVVTTCGTGVTAAILALGLYLLGEENVAVYDGSWTERGRRTDTPAVTGADA
jgi:thiosulfate/3-mercaptopyruvate sulfurtransferase